MKLKVLTCFPLIAVFTLLTLTARAQTFSVIYSFKGGAFDGVSPSGGVTIKGSTLYGVTTGGGNSCGIKGACGTVYQLRDTGSNWLENLIVLFPSSNGGIFPVARVLFGPDGHLFGTANESWSGSGSVYRLTPPLSVCKTVACLFWTAIDLHTFTGDSRDGDGANPAYGDLIWDQDGNIYGTTYGGGAWGCGTVFKMTGSGDNWTETPIYSFTGYSFSQLDGCYPYDGLVMDSKGNLFGTTNYAGDNNNGTVWELTYDPQAGWKENNLYSFTGQGDGGSPYAGLTLGSSGNLYGATSRGTPGPTIFELSPSGDKWAFTVLANIPGCTEGGPFVVLTSDAAGSLYGTNYACGVNSFGNIFKLTNTNNGWVYTSLHDFTGGADGAFPQSQVTIDVDGTLYGTASQGGTNNRGVIWMIKP